jgi:hypothetical protein
MTALAIIQIAYLVINFLGFVLSIINLCSTGDFPIIHRLFDFIRLRLGNVVLAVAGLLFIVLFLPTITFNAAIVIFLVLWA